MPDIQTAFKQALSKTLAQWDDEGESPPVQPVSASFSQPTQPTKELPVKKTFNVTNNISRVTFDYIKNNPGSTRKEIIEALEHQGFAGGSTSSLIAQMRRNNMIHETNKLYYADIPEYRPIKSLKAMKKMEQVPAPPKRKYEKKAVTGIGALLKEKLENTPMPKYIQHALHTPPDRDERKANVILVRTRSPEDILKDMTVYQARELYVHLKQMFGG
jgi:hypothetical protein